MLPATLGALKPGRPPIYDLWGWGDRSSGALGDGIISATRTYGPVLLSSQIPIAYAASYANFGFHILRSGEMFFAGDNTKGQSGLGDTMSRSTWASCGLGWTKVKCGVGDNDGNEWFSIALKTDGSLWHAGSYVLGSAGDGTTTGAHNSWTKIADGPFVDFDIGWGHGIALDVVGHVYTWGRAYAGQTAQHTTVPASGADLFDRAIWLDPVSGNVLSVYGARVIAASYTGSIVMSVIPGHGSYFCTTGQFGDNPRGSAIYPYFIPTTSPVADVSTITEISATTMQRWLGNWAVKTNDGAWYIAGDGQSDGLGNGTTGISNPVAGLSNPPSSQWRSIAFLSSRATNEQGMIGLAEDGNLYGWGSNKINGLGVSTTTNTSTPQLIGSGYGGICESGGCGVAYAWQGPMPPAPPIPRPPSIDDGWIPGSPLPVVSLTDVVVSHPEGTGAFSNDVTLFEFHFSITGARAWNIYFDWVIQGTGTYPAAASDFLIVPGSSTNPDTDYYLYPLSPVGIIPSLTMSRIAIAVLQDHTAEFDETFTLTLSNPYHCTLGVSTAVGTIINDD